MPNQSDQNQSNTIPVIPDFQSDVPPIPTDTSSAPIPPQPTPPAQPELNMPTEIGSSTPPETPPIISTTPKKKFGGGKIIATILGFLILAGGIAGGVILTQQQQDIREKAGACVDVDCAITKDPVGKYHYKKEMDRDKDEGLDGKLKVGEGLTDEQYFEQVLVQLSEGEDVDNEDNDCTGDGICPSGSTCLNNACVSNSLACKLGDPNAPGCCANLNEADCEDVVCENGPAGARKECRIGGAGGQHCTLSVGGGNECGPSNPPDEPPGDIPTPTPPTAICQEVRAYKPALPTQLTALELTQLEVGDSVRFCVSGGPTASGFDKARFTINGTLQTETTTPTDAGMAPFVGFCQTYTIPANTTVFNISAQIHHSTLDWK
jgi:hypothetical protein